jgi:hypothetical protein
MMAEELQEVCVEDREAQCVDQLNPVLVASIFNPRVQ